MDTFGPEDADAWYERNKHKLGVGMDPVMKSIEWADIKPSRVIEVGCANGWRLAKLEEKYGCPSVFGIEMSDRAIEDSPKWMTAYKPSERNRIAYRCDTVIHGFDLYLYEPNELFHEVYWADGMLLDGGHLIIHDFLPEHPYSRIFEHNKRGIKF